MVTGKLNFKPAVYAEHTDDLITSMSDVRIFRFLNNPIRYLIILKKII